MRKIFLLILAYFLGSILHAQQFYISAEITGFKNGTKFYLEDPAAQKVIDSAVMNNHSFSFKGSLSYVPNSVFLSTTTEKEYYWCFLFIGNEKVSIKGDKSDFPFYLQIRGSKSQDIYNKLNNKTRALNTKRNKLTENVGQLLSDESDSAKAELKSIGKQLHHIDSLTDSIRLQFIQSNINSYAALNELYFLRTRFSKDSLQLMYHGLRKEYRESVYGERIASYLKVGNILKVGDLYSEFEGTDQSGTLHKLSDFTGKYILLDFTETYCGPCVLSVEELKKISQDYSDSLRIISFCADQSKDIWKKGLERDKSGWTCLWDGKGNYGETILKYGVQGYPTFYIINPQGRIISKWSGYGKGEILKHIKGKIMKIDGNGR